MGRPSVAPLEVVVDGVVCPARVVVDVGAPVVAAAAEVVLSPVVRFVVGEVLALVLVDEGQMTTKLVMVLLLVLVVTAVVEPVLGTTTRSGLQPVRAKAMMTECLIILSLSYPPMPGRPSIGRRLPGHGRNLVPGLTSSLHRQHRRRSGIGVKFDADILTVLNPTA